MDFFATLAEALDASPFAHAVVSTSLGYIAVSNAATEREIHRLYPDSTTEWYR